jgi:hypothetical protein
VAVAWQKWQCDSVHFCEAIWNCGTWFDEVSTKLLKISATYICSPLTYFCNKSILSVIFPDRMKFSIIKRIYKKGNKMNPTNYRRISLLTSFRRFLKKLYILD